MICRDWAMDARTAADYAGGRLVGDGLVKFINARADSRLCRSGDLFVALPGEHADGCMFISDAWARGASVVLADAAKVTDFPPEGCAYILADNPLSSLQELARQWRLSLREIRIVGITGSNGKTTTKNILSGILNAWLGDRVFAVRGNYNSDIGLPLTLLSLRERHRIGVLEMGMNYPGEMTVLASIARPDVGVVTNVGTAHIGLLGSREGIAAEKRAVFSQMGTDGTAIVPESDDWRDYLVEGFPGRVVNFGGRGNYSGLSFFGDDEHGNIAVIGSRKVPFHSTVF